jgi:hypothetical protein
VFIFKEHQGQKHKDDYYKKSLHSTRHFSPPVALAQVWEVSLFSSWQVNNPCVLLVPGRAA